MDFSEAPREQVALLMGLRSETVRWQPHYGMHLQWTSHLIRQLQPSESVVDIRDIHVELGLRVLQTPDRLGHRMDDQSRFMQGHRLFFLHRIQTGYRDWRLLKVLSPWS
jgi:hypothetical protein